MISVKGKKNIWCMLIKKRRIFGKCGNGGNKRESFILERKKKRDRKLKILFLWWLDK